jgi:hypothetical protein
MVFVRSVSEIESAEVNRAAADSARHRGIPFAKLWCFADY